MDRDLLVYALAAVAAASVLAALLFRPAGGTARIAEIDRRLHAEAEALRRGLTELDQGLRREIAVAMRSGVAEAFDRVLEGHAAMQAVLAAFGTQQGQHWAAMADRLQGGFASFAEAQRAEQERLRALVATQLETMRAGNEAKLEAMRHAVDEKLQAALESKVTESFQRVTEQLAQLHQDIGQVQSVAGEVGDLKRLFGNVSARGGWGEAHLETLLADVLHADGYARDVQLRDGSRESVEFALRIPLKGRADLWLAIDSKFPTADYDALLDAAATGDAEAQARARRSLEQRIRAEAARIGKYIVPPRTTDFAIMYLPTDGLFAEVARSPGLMEELRRTYRVTVMGPSLLPPLLHTIRLGFLMLSIEANAGGIERTLGAVKTEWGQLGGAIDAIAKSAHALSNNIERVQTRARAVGGKLRGIEALERATAERMLGLDGSEPVASGAEE